MPNGRSHKSYDDYGPHEYAEHDGTSNCKYRCGCWMGPARSGGPAGIDPFGHCPNNSLDGKKQAGGDDYEDCVNGLIAKLRHELFEAKLCVDIVERSRKGTKVDLVNRLNEAEGVITRLRNLLEEIQKSLSSNIKLISDSLG